MKRYTVDTAVPGSSRRGTSVLGTTHFPRVIQFTWWTCGPCSVYSVLKFFNCDAEYSDVRTALETTRTAGTMEGPVVRCLRAHGLRVARRPSLSWVGLRAALAAGSVVLVGLDAGKHYGVVYGYDPVLELVYLADPSLRRLLGGHLSRQKFNARWARDGLIVRPPQRHH